MKNKFKICDKVCCRFGKKLKYGIIVDVINRGDISPLCYVLFLKDRTLKEYKKPFIKAYDAAWLEATDIEMVLPEKKYGKLRK